MRKNRGFRIKHKLAKVFKWGLFNAKASSINRYQRLNSSSSTRKGIVNLCNWVKGFCIQKPGKGCIRMDHDPVDYNPVSNPPPKGHLAVYVGESDNDTQRYMVPVVYFNHPLFGELLKESEKEFGFNHSGGIQIPCRLSEFETVQTRIAAGENYQRRSRKYW